MSEAQLQDDCDIHGRANPRRPITSRSRKFQAHRQASRVPLDCQVFYSGIALQGEGVVRDISLGGCQVEGNAPVKPGTKLSLVLTIPDPYSPTVVDRTFVVWSDGNRFGLQYEVLLPTERNRLEMLLHRSDQGRKY